MKQMKNTIKDLNTIIVYTDINLVKKNIVFVTLTGTGEMFKIKLTASKMKLFVKYGLDEIHNTNQDLVDRDIILNDIENFRKYYNGFSFAINLTNIKKIFTKNNISLELLYRYVNSLDYLWLKGLDENLLHNGILIEKYKYTNILVDLMSESIPKEIIYDYPICVLFKFYKSTNDYIIRLEESGKLDRYSSMLAKLEKENYISRWYYQDEELLDLESFSHIKKYRYNGYCGNYETYFTFKALLIVYLDGISIYNYKDKYYTYEGLKEVYDLYSWDHAKFMNDLMLKYKNNIDETFEDIIKYNSDVTQITSKCIDVEDLKN